MTDNVTHEWVEDVVEAYLAGGLSAAERAALDGHVRGCAACAAVVAGRRDEDERLLAAFEVARPGVDFEERMVQRVQENLMKTPRMRVMTKRFAAGAVAMLVLGSTGALAN